MTAGFIWAHRLQGRYWNGDPKVVITILILAAYVGYTLLARTPAWRGARASALCIFNFAFVIFSYSIVNRYLRTFTVTSDWVRTQGCTGIGRAFRKWKSFSSD